MISKLENKLKDMILELETYNHKDKKLLLASKIKSRLDKSLDTYYKQLNITLDKLSNYDEKYHLQLVKRLNK